jgi:hypothetical protein
MSLYVTDPSNLRLEFTVDHPDLERIDAEQRAHAHAALRRWLSGDHTPNNDFRTRESGPGLRRHAIAYLTAEMVSGRAAE